VEASLAERDSEQAELVEGLVQLVVDLRKELKYRKVWDVADRIRRELGEVGVELEDTPEGTRWRRKRRG